MSHSLACHVSRSEGPTPAEWERFRPTITSLYRKEQLEAVRETMSRQHGFTASAKMYKTRIKLWGLDKKRKAPEMLTGLMIIKRRKPLGKSTCIVVEERNRTFTEAEIESYFKRHKMSASEQHLLETAKAAIPPGIGYFTPPSGNSPMLVADDVSVALSSIPKTPVSSIRPCPAQSLMQVSDPSGPSWVTQMKATTAPGDSTQRREDTYLHNTDSWNSGQLDLIELMSLSADDILYRLLKPLHAMKRLLHHSVTTTNAILDLSYGLSGWTKISAFLSNCFLGRRKWMVLIYNPRFPVVKDERFFHIPSSKILHGLLEPSKWQSVFMEL